jgi:cephalosporin hydroxylase
MAKLKIPRLLLIAGNGRNSGKTLFACSVISNLCKEIMIIAVKISPHSYAADAKNAIIPGVFSVTEETSVLSGKDSSRMLAAGAVRSIFITADDSHLTDVVDLLKKLAVSGSYIVCESGGLSSFIKPGLFIIVNRNDNRVIKHRLREYLENEHTMVTFNGERFNPDPREIIIDCKNEKWTFNND